MWKKAIYETLLLIKMEKAAHNKRAQKEEGAKPQSDKLAYQELIPCLTEVTSIWEQMLAVHEREDEGGGGREHEEEEKTVPNARLMEYAKRGVPRDLRGRIWLFLMQQRRLSSTVPDSRCESTKYEELLEGESPHQNAILIDTGRTFPGHPYFSKTLGPGQVELYNILKAYSQLDPEVGYCQGLCFVVGILLMHMEEISAFHVLKYMMHDLGLRKQFRPNMLALQIKLFQLKRLIHDHYKDVYDHFESHEITPSLYATPWFLTLFASQFPLGFVARVFDMIFVQGVDAMFKVALLLIGHYRTQILEHDCFESIADFLKTTLPELVRPKMIRIINEAFELDITVELQAYEVEFYVCSEEMTSSPTQPRESSSGSSTDGGSSRSSTSEEGDDAEKPPPRYMQRRRKSIDLTLMHRMVRQNEALKAQNKELMDKYQHAQSQQRSSELSHLAHEIENNKMKAYVWALERERSALLSAMAKLYKLVPRALLHHVTRSVSSQVTPPPSPSPFSISKGNFSFAFMTTSDEAETPRARDSSPEGNSWSLMDRRKVSIDLNMIYDMEHENGALKNQNMELIEKIQRAQYQQRTSEIGLCSLQLEKDKLKVKVRAMEIERSALLVSMAKMWKAAPREARRRLGLHVAASSTPPDSPAIKPPFKHNPFPPSSSSSSSSSSSAMSRPKFSSTPILRKASDTPPPSPTTLVTLEKDADSTFASVTVSCSGSSSDEGLPASDSSGASSDVEAGSESKEADKTLPPVIPVEKVSPSTSNAPEKVQSNGTRHISTAKTIASGIGPVSSVEEQDPNRSHRPWSDNVALKHVVWC